MAMRLIEVDWDATARSWSVYARPDVDMEFDRFEGGEAELADLLALAHDVATGG